MRHCAFCGTELPEQAQFCGYCGRLSSLSGEWPQPRITPSSTWSQQDEPTIISNTSLPTLINDQQKLLRSQQEERTLLTPDNNAVWTPPVVRQLHAEEEQDRARRAMIWGVPLSGAPIQGPTGAPIVQGTPPINGAPLVSGTPLLHLAGEGRYTPSPDPQAAQRGQFGRQSKHASSSRARFAGGAAAQWVIVIVTALVVLTSAGVGVALAVSPSLSLTGGLSGNSVVMPGQHLSLHGSGFLPGGHITLKRDTGQIVQMATSNTAPQSIQTFALATFAFTASARGSVIVSASGTFDAVLQVGNDWHRGSHTIHATEDVFSRSATMTVNVDNTPPALSVSPASLDLGLVQKGTKTSASLAIGNTGGKPLTWSAESVGTKWLSMDTVSGDVLPYGAPESLAVSCDTTSLALGVYSATIHVHAAGNTVDVKVILHVVAQKQAQLVVSSGTLDFQTMDVGQQATRVLSISNTGTLKLNWQAVSSENWVVLSSASGSILPGGATQRLNVEVDTTGLLAGSYSATLTMSSNGGSTQVTIFLTVPAPPQPTPTAIPTVVPTATPTATAIPTVTPTPTPITPTPTTMPGQPYVPTTLDFGTVVQGQPASLSLSLGNSGGTSLTWKAQSGDQWVSIDNPGGTLDPNTTATINVTVDTTALTGPKTYQSILTFYTSGGDVTVTITITIPQPAITVPPAVTPKPTSIPIH